MILDSPIVTGSIVVSGSTIFGSSLNTKHQFTGSVNITGSLALNGSNVLLSNQTSSISVLSASYSITSSLSLNSELLDGYDSAAFLLTSSYNNFTASYLINSSSFSSSIAQLQDFSSSLDSGYVTEAELQAATSSLSGSISYLSSSYLASSASFNTRILNNSSSIGLLSGSYLNSSSSFDTRILNNSSSIGILSSSYLNSSSSFDTRILNNSSSIGTLSGSYLNSSSSFDTRILNNSSSIGLLSGSYLASSASFDTRILTNSSSIGLLSGSYLNSSASFDTRILNNSSSIGLLSGSYLNSSSSFDSRIDVIESNYATTGSNTFIGNQEIQGNVYVNNTSNALGFSTTSSLYTDGGLRVTKDAYISGSTFIAGNLTVYGTSSIEYITSSVLVGLEYINLNTDLPALRYAGINVGDSGSASGISSSLWYDSQKDNWLVVYAPAGSSQQTSSLAINGPITYNNVGNEQGLLGNYIVKSQLVTADNNHHITSSQIFDDGTTVAIAGKLQVTGSLSALNLTGSLNGSNLVAGSVANDRLTNSTISGKALGTNLDTLTIGTGLSGTSYNGSTAVTIANTGVTAFNTRTGGVSLQASDISGLAAGIVSGSSQVTGLTNANLSGTAGITNANLANSSITVTAGTGMSGGGAVSLGGTVTLTNAGVTSAVAGTGIGVSGATGAVTISIGQAVATSSNVQFNSLGVGTAGSAVVGEIRATADVTAFYSSDERLKEDIIPIDNPIEKLMAINGVIFNWKEGFETLHSHTGSDTGVIAQQIEAIELPGVVTTRDTGYKAVNYEKLNALLIEGFKAQQLQIDELKVLVNQLLNK